MGSFAFLFRMGQSFHLAGKGWSTYMSKALFKSTLRAIKLTFGRFMSIVLIVALGVCFFAGFKATSPDMNKTANKYFRENNLMDLRVQSTLGLLPEDLREIKKVEGVEYVMPAKFIDGLVFVDGEAVMNKDGSHITARAYGIDLKMFASYLRGTNDGEFINRPTLLEGDYPKEPGQCLVDRNKFSVPECYKIGNKIRLEGDGDSIFSSLDVNEFTIVGVIESPYYISFERGNTLIGGGKVGTYIYIPNEAFCAEYYSEVYITVEGSKDFDAFSDEYFKHLEPVKEALELIVPERLASRANLLTISLPDQIVRGKAELEQRTIEKNSKLAEAWDNLKKLEEIARDGERMYYEADKAFREEFAHVESQLIMTRAELDAAMLTYNRLRAAVDAAQLEYMQKKALQQEAYTVFRTAENDFNRKKTQVENTKLQIETTNSFIETALQVIAEMEAFGSTQRDDPQIAGLLNALEVTQPALYNLISTLPAQALGFEVARAIEPVLKARQLEMLNLKNQLDEAQPLLEQAETYFNEMNVFFTAANKASASAQITLQAAEQQLQAMFDAIQTNNTGLTFAEYQLVAKKLQKQFELNEFKRLVDNGEEEYKKAADMYYEAELEANKLVNLAQTKISGAEKLLESIDEAEWYILDRRDTPGYTSYSDAIDNVKSLANIFPLFIFLLAVLVSISAIARMVDEERVQFGTLSALGYAPVSIAMKYILYAVFASIIGCAIGLVAGFYGIPRIAMLAYGIMFDLPKVIITLPWQYIVMSVIFAIFSTIFAALIACRKDLGVNPAILMRPKPPKSGKKVFLEDIRFIWSRLPFNAKVTLRNLLRSPKRFVMTLFGMAGCTALMLASFGFYDSVQAIMANQYEDGGISKYDVQFVFADQQDPDKKSDAMTTILSDTRIEDAMLISMQSVSGSSERADKFYDIYVYVPAVSGELNNYIELRDRKTKTPVIMTDESVLLTEAFARDTKTGVGDTIFVKDPGGKITELTVTGVVENYTFSYVYVARPVYVREFGVEPRFNCAVGRLTEKVRAEAASAGTGQSTSKSLLAADMMKHYQINAVGYTTNTYEMFSEIIRTISIVVIMFIAAAMLLALVILYNLSNTNINEKTRELSILKVVGFYDKEVTSYVQRENLISTALSIILGLVMGIGVHRLLIRFTEIEMVMFGRSIWWPSYIYAAALSFAFSMLINYIMRRKVRKIDMLDSFKSVE